MTKWNLSRSYENNPKDITPLLRKTISYKYASMVWISIRQIESIYFNGMWRNKCFVKKIINAKALKWKNQGLLFEMKHFKIKLFFFHNKIYSAKITLPVLSDNQSKKFFQSELQECKGAFIPAWNWERTVIEEKDIFVHYNFSPFVSI